MAYIRSSVKEEYHDYGKKAHKHILITEPVDLMFEKYCLEVYLKIV